MINKDPTEVAQIGSQTYEHNIMSSSGAAVRHWQACHSALSAAAPLCWLASDSVAQPFWFTLASRLVIQHPGSPARQGMYS